MDRNRNWRFRERIKFERQVITTVNKSPSVSTPLCGVTLAAIHRWSDTLRGTNLEPKRNGIVWALTEMARRLDSLACSSHDAFEDGDLILEEPLDDLLAFVERELASSETRL
ncbi:hypothetical protein [Azospirillum argentinense]|uniref:hypothetical protein n=1 Tax=Azospirillum argentinense TaxID=2970906 RepID=UPI0032E001E3